MKTTITSLICAALAFSYSFAQMESETVSTGPGQANQHWYSLENGSQGTALANEWDIAFGVSGIGSSIHINSEQGVELWIYPNGAIGDWATVDTAGLSTWPNVYDSDTSWSYGAFDMTADANDDFDLGWGVYDMITHQVQGDSIHIIKLTDGCFKKIKIDNLASGTYNFTFADLDGSNEVSTSIAKSNYADKLFGYYSIVNEIALDREPVNSAEWDFLFTTHLTFFGSTAYPVGSILTNPNVLVAEETGIADPQSYNDYQTANYESVKNVIGGDWKSFNGSGYDIADDRVYFVQTQSGDFWKVIPTGYGGSSSGDYMFSKEKLATASVGEQESPIMEFAIYPNPNSGNELNLLYNSSSDHAFETVVYSSTGRMITQFSSELNGGFQKKTIDISSLTTGVYFVKVVAGEFSTMQKLIINK